MKELSEKYFNAFTAGNIVVASAIETITGVPWRYQLVSHSAVYVTYRKVVFLVCGNPALCTFAPYGLTQHFTVMTNLGLLRLGVRTHDMNDWVYFGGKSHLSFRYVKC